MGLCVRERVITIKHVHNEANHCVDKLTKDNPISARDFNIYLVIPSCISNCIRENLLGLDFPQTVSVRV